MLRAIIAKIMSYFKRCYVVLGRKLKSAKLSQISINRGGSKKRAPGGRPSRVEARSSRQLQKGLTVVDSQRLSKLQQSRQTHKRATDRARKRQLSRLKQQLVYLIVGLLFGALMLSRLFITKVSVHGVSGPEGNRAHQMVAERYFSGFSNKFKLNFDANDFENFFIENSQGVTGVEVDMGILSTVLNIHIVEHANGLGWIDQRRDKYFLLDTDGVVFEQVDLLPSNLPVVTDVSGVRAELGSQLLSASSVSFVAALYGEAQAYDIGLSGMIIGETTRDIEATLDGQTFRVKFNSSREAFAQLRDLNLALDHLAGQGEQPLEYIDVRVEEKVFYK